MPLEDSLAQLLGPRGVLAGADVSGKYASDWSKSSFVRPPLVLRPQSTEELAKALALCNAARHAVVVQGGLTGLCGGASPQEGEIALSLERLDRIEHVDPVDMTITVQAGVTLQRVQDAAGEYGLTFPLDFGARGSCTIGGSLATNAGGNGVIRYGVARGLALGLEAVLADGTILTSLNRMVKNSSGYDLKQLFIGSEGTLGVITRAVLRLYPSLPHRTTVLISAPSFDGVQGILVLAKSRLGAGLTAFEVMWQSYVQAVLAVYPELRSLVSLAPGFWCLIEHERASGDDDAEVEAFLEAATRAGHANDALLAQSERQTEEFWRLRDGAGELLTLWRHPLAFDVSLPIAAMPDYCAQVETALRQRFAELPFTCFGHLGDGTLHFVLDAPAEEDKEWLVATILELVRPHGGAISAEHGIGVLKKPWLHLSRSPGEIEVMRRLKRLLDPHGILNPGRVFTP